MTALRWLLALFLVAALGACGLPDNTGVVPRGPGPSPGTGTGDDPAPVRQSREATTDRAEFVDNFLEAAAGDPDRATERVLEFLAPPLRDGFKPTTEIAVVRPLDAPLINPGDITVLLKVQHLGVLKKNGVLEPPTPPRQQELRLDIAPVEGATGLFVTNAPAVPMISDRALESFYERRPIYWWNTERTGLVPDIRYLPREVPLEGQPTEILEWLAGGPSSLVDPAVESLPDDTAQIGNVPAAADGKLSINLTGTAVPPDDPDALRRLGSQLQWSLRPNLGSVTLELKIDHQVRGNFRGTDYLADNPAWRVVGRPERFCVLTGQVRRMRTSVADPAEPVPGVDDTVNRGVRTAALATAGDTTYAALVAAEGGRTVLRVGTTRPGRAGGFSRTGLAEPVGRPVWAVTPADGNPTGGLGLVVTGGRLFSFSTNGADPRPVDWQNPPGRITDVAVAPDGRRIAVIAGGALYVTVATPGGADMRILGTPQRIGTLLGDLSAVAWSSEQSVLVAGRKGNGRVAIMDVTIDGTAQSDRLPDLGNFPVHYLVAYPANPGSSPGADAVSYMANNQAYDANASPQRIEIADVAGPPPPPGTTAVPTAPFFLS